MWRADLDLAESTPAAAASSLRRFLAPVYVGNADLMWNPTIQEWERQR